MLAQSARLLQGPLLQSSMLGALKQASETMRAQGFSRLLSASPQPKEGDDNNPWVSMFPKEDGKCESHIFKLNSGQGVAAHPGMQKDFDASYLLAQPAYSKEYVESVAPVHKPPAKLHETLGLAAIRTVRSLFDIATGWNNGPITEAKCLQRIIFLETVAGVPGMVAGMLRHMRSLRTMKRDHGWIHTLLEEAENERMHLLVYMQMRNPGLAFRAGVLVAQGVFFNFFFLSYLVSPRTCHSFVGYLEEEAVKTYTKIIEEVEAGRIWKDVEAPPLARAYWRLGPKATIRDALLATRADEQCHSHVNHTLANLATDDPNPFNATARQ